MNNANDIKNNKFLHSIENKDSRGKFYTEIKDNKIDYKYVNEGDNKNYYNFYMDT